MVSKGAAGSVDAREYNAVAIESTTGDAANNNDDTLLVGGPDAEYNGCPNVLVLDHFFDGATVTTHKGATGVDPATVTTDLTVVPCGEDFTSSNIGALNPITLQFLVFNEFEQRFSTSANLSCWREVQLSDIDTRVGSAGNQQSIFSSAVEGTLTGQSRIRSVVGGNAGNTVVGIAEEFWTATAGPGGRFTNATNIHFTGSRDQGDQIVLHPDSTQ